jgi:staphylococcal nuclease domain-containing protein 1
VYPKDFWRCALENSLSKLYLFIFLNYFASFSQYIQGLLDLQEKAKVAKKGRWSDDSPSNHVRNVQWVISDPKALVDKYSGKKVEAVIEQVRDGSTVRAFLLPNFEYVTITLSGIKVQQYSDE